MQCILTTQQMKAYPTIAQALTICEAGLNLPSSVGLIGEAIAVELFGASARSGRSIDCSFPDGTNVQVKTMWQATSKGESEFFGNLKDYTMDQVLFIQLNADFSFRRFSVLSASEAERLILTQSPTYWYPPDGCGGYKTNLGGYMQLKTLTANHLWSNTLPAATQSS
jgi:hypothetical protein